jgi:hypothetical protein
VVEVIEGAGEGEKERERGREGGREGGKEEKGGGVDWTWDGGRGGGVGLFKEKMLCCLLRLTGVLS